MIAGISAVLDAEFACEVYMEEIEQDFQEPCFFISCISPADTPYPGKRRRREHQFDICYFPESEKNAVEECNRVAERLYGCLESINVSGAGIRGCRMHYETVDGVLHFFVNYNFFMRAAGDHAYMGTLRRDTGVKGR